ncbi:hypothetical protein AVEN_18908-1 [Araneus ventricosus]|uniref:Uncharacterized protein n=1 Tax=Araneus ventricosus TaxID=182803 RepID=A0A4Y2UP33_ARAVE|nr:hypothetical protein AVEN_18908-1 [Araneus ventricosus]
MTRMTPELAPPSKLPHHTSGRTFDPLRMISSETGPIHDGSSVESGIEPGSLRFRGRTSTLGHRGLLFLDMNLMDLVTHAQESNKKRIPKQYLATAHEIAPRKIGEKKVGTVNSTLTKVKQK